MARREDRAQSDAAQLYELAVMNDLVHDHGGEAQAVAELRIARRALEQRAVTFAGDHPRAAGAFEVHQAAGVIGMRVAVEQDANVVHLEAKLLDVSLDRGGQRG